MGWHNDRKALYWRLLVNGLPFSSRFNRGVPCVCDGHDAHNPGRLHHFWDCPAAQPVVALMARECGGDMPDALTRPHVWLMIVPSSLRARYGSQPWLQLLWRVVCLAALNAMWFAAQSILNAAPAGASTGDAGDPNAMLSARALLHFRVLLEEFVRVGRPPGAWARLLPRDAPFFTVDHCGDLQVTLQWE
jgi:hypothetical protein